MEFPKNIPLKIKSYIRAEYDMWWRFDFAQEYKEGDQMKIYEKFMKCFGSWCNLDDDLEKETREKLNTKYGIYGFGFLTHIYLKTLNNNTIKPSMLFSSVEFNFSKHPSSLWIMIKVNLYSDYVRSIRGRSETYPDIEFGEILDFSDFAYKNRENLEKSMRGFERELGGEIVDWSPQKGVYEPHYKEDNKKCNDWKAEEIYKYGFKPMTERKEEYEEKWKE